ncbi:MAG TPA: GTP 3',8-cyclase MoaA [Gammaproteobacteria bacterium]
MSDSEKSNVNSEKSGLTDSFGRTIDYVRLSVTDQCDLRCFYCLPERFKGFSEPDHWLSFDEIERVIRGFAELGVTRVRVTGGEPLVRKDLPNLIRRLAHIPQLKELSLSTNGTRLDKLAHDLKCAGVSRVNVSLDTLNPERFKSITGGKLEKVLRGLMAAKAAGLYPIKINMVALQGVNDDEVMDMVGFCVEHGFTLRFIETMPIGDTGREASSHYLNLDIVKQRLEKKYDLIPAVMVGGGPARYVRVAGTGVTIGFITPISRHFCETCNRVRLSTEGSLVLCLGQNDVVPLRTLLRTGISDERLKQVLQQAIKHKPHRHHFNEKPQQIVRFMAHTGG